MGYLIIDIKKKKGKKKLICCPTLNRNREVKEANRKSPMRS